MAPFTNVYISMRTRQYVQGALADGTLVSPDFERDNDGQHPESKRDLDTPKSFISEVCQIWTLDMGLTEQREAEIKAIVTQVVTEELPEDLRQYLA